MTLKCIEVHFSVNPISIITQSAPMKKAGVHIGAPFLETQSHFLFKKSRYIRSFSPTVVLSLSPGTKCLEIKSPFLKTTHTHTHRSHWSHTATTKNTTPSLGVPCETTPPWKRSPVLVLPKAPPMPILAHSRTFAEMDCPQ